MYSISMTGAEVKGQSDVTYRHLPCQPATKLTLPHSDNRWRSYKLSGTVNTPVLSSTTQRLAAYVHEHTWAVMASPRMTLSVDRGSSVSSLSPPPTDCRPSFQGNCADRRGYVIALWLAVRVRAGLSCCQWKRGGTPSLIHSGMWRRRKIKKWKMFLLKRR